METFLGIMIPFLGTALGSACVFFMKKSLGVSVQRALTGFAAGVMVAASIWSLLIPAIEQSEGMGKLSFLPAFIGFWVGVLFLLLLDHLIPHLHVGSNQAEGPKSRLGRTTMMVLAVTLHNIPEGMAVGVMYAGFLAGNAQITAASALVLSLGIAIQNFPEGAIISMPLRAEGERKADAGFESEKYRKTCLLFFKLMCATSLGKLCASDHAMNAIDEMNALNRDIKKFFDENGAAYPVWQALEAEAGRYLR